MRLAFARYHGSVAAQANMESTACIMADDDSYQRAQEIQYQKEREVLFASETLLIKILQAVPGGALVGALSQADTLIDLAGIGSFLVFLSAMGCALVAAVFAAHWKHQHASWEVDTTAADMKVEAPQRARKASRYLKAMRAGLWVALLLVAAGFMQLVVCLWIVGLSGQDTDSDTQAAGYTAFSGGTSLAAGDQSPVRRQHLRHACLQCFRVQRLNSSRSSGSYNCVDS